MALPPRPREGRWGDLGAFLFPAPCPPLLPSRGQSEVAFLLEGSRIPGCPKRAPSAARPLSRGPWALIGLPFSVWAGACYWHGVGGSVFNSSSSSPASFGRFWLGLAGFGWVCPALPGFARLCPAVVVGFRLTSPALTGSAKEDTSRPRCHTDDGRTPNFAACSAESTSANPAATMSSAAVRPRASRRMGSAPEKGTSWRRGVACSIAVAPPCENWVRRGHDGAASQERNAQSPLYPL